MSKKSKKNLKENAIKIYDGEEMLFYVNKRMLCLPKKFKKAMTRRKGITAMIMSIISFIIGVGVSFLGWI